MVQTVEKGKDRIRRVTCPQCDSIIAYDKQGVKKTYKSRYNLETEEIRYVTCPECQHDIEVSRRVLDVGDKEARTC